MRRQPPNGEFIQQRPTATFPIGQAAPSRDPHPVAAENLGKTDAVLDPLRDKWLSLTSGLDHCAESVSHDLRGGVATTGGLKG